MKTLLLDNGTRVPSDLGDLPTRARNCLLREGLYTKEAAREYVLQKAQENRRYWQRRGRKESPLFLWVPLIKLPECGRKTVVVLMDYLFGGEGYETPPW